MATPHNNNNNRKINRRESNKTKKAEINKGVDGSTVLSTHDNAVLVFDYKLNSSKQSVHDLVTLKVKY